MSKPRPYCAETNCSFRVWEEASAERCYGHAIDLETDPEQRRKQAKALAEVRGKGKKATR